MVVIPARGGSKGIRRKNLQEIHGKSLTEWAILSAGKISLEKKVVVSSDDSEILAIAKKYEFADSSYRPESLSGDAVADFQVLRFELSEAEKRFSMEFACVVMLQPTSPIRRPETISACISSVLRGESTATWTVSKVPKKFHPRKQLHLKEGRLEMAVSSPLVVRRQELDQTFIRTGACYAISRNTLLSDDKLLGMNAHPYVCPWPNSNIDDLEDLNEARELTVESEGILVPRGPR